MSTPSNRLSLSEIMHEIGTILRTPIPGAEFLDTVIPIQRLFDRANRSVPREVRETSQPKPRRDLKVAPAAPQPFVTQGLLRRNPSGDFFVGNEPVEIDESTWIFGELDNGAFVVASGDIMPGGKKCAKKLIVKTGGGLS